VVQPFGGLAGKLNAESIQTDFLNTARRHSLVVRCHNNDITGVERRCIYRLAEPDIHMLDRAGNVTSWSVIGRARRNCIENQRELV